MDEMPALRRAAHALEDLDVSLGFARLALEMQHVRPVLDNSCATLSGDGAELAVATWTSATAGM